MFNSKFYRFMFQIILQVFDGNSGKHDIVKNSLEEYASARFIRFQPTAFNIHKPLRVEVFGALVSAGNFSLHFAENILFTSFEVHVGRHP